MKVKKKDNIPHSKQSKMSLRHRHRLPKKRNYNNDEDGLRCEPLEVCLYKPMELMYDVMNIHRSNLIMRIHVHSHFTIIQEKIAKTGKGHREGKKSYQSCSTICFLFH